MKLKSIKVKNYKSIDEVEIPIKKRNGSYTTILLGKNETGKSNILEALSSLDVYNSEAELEFLNIRNQQNEAELVSIFYSIEAENPEDYRRYIADTIKISEDILPKITVDKAVKEIFLTEDSSQFCAEWQITLKSFPTNNKFFKVTTETIPGKVVNGIQQATTTKKTTEIVYWVDIKDLEEDQRTKYEPLTREKFEEIIIPLIESYFDMSGLDVSMWTTSPDYLIQDSISLSDFAEKPYKYPPLKNIFSLAGLNTTSEINSKIKEISQNSNYRRRLQKKLSEETTNYLNEKWPEHKVLIDVEISDELNIHVKVQDKDNTDAYHNMEERSQGFKHFISLLLSLSVNHKTGDLKNSLILIDEPEVHLHPSGIRYMLQELLEIGKNNYVFISTHSNFMLDKNTRERHYLTTKKEGKTKIKQISSAEDLNNDEVLQAAFGINVIRDFISKYKLLVEGASDKILLQKSLNKLNKDNCIAITNGQGDNLCGIAALAQYHEIYPIVIVDDDEEGQKIKRDILRLAGNYTEANVLTIRDICGNIKSCGTIEDTLPVNYVTSKTNHVLKSEGLANIILNEEEAFCKQIKLHIQRQISDSSRSKKEQKDLLNSLMTKIKKTISDDFSMRNLETEAPLLHKLASTILAKFN